MEIYLPKLFEIMTVHDVVKVTQWYVSQGSTVKPGDNLVQVRAPGRTITIPTPPELKVPHRVVEIAKGEQEEVRLGDLLIKLESVES